ncbi:MAG TPA: thioredoxin-dependent thiol peroxidase [Dysgonomonas sp.]|nr:thioredoxin-dependent thiol peroxidase [Dysgonomonas sp.]
MAFNIGDKIPQVLGIDQDGKEVRSDEYAGKKFILYFYPKDNTPGCSAEACNFRDNFYELRHEGYEIVGVSVDDVDSHNKFIEKYELPFRLISDKDKTLVNEFGLWAEKTFAGRKYMGTLRTTFLVDEEGVIEHIFTSKEIKAKDHAEQILEWLNKKSANK